MCYDIPLFKGLVAGLPLIGTKDGALRYKSVGRSRIQDSIRINNIINCYRHDDDDDDDDYYFRPVGPPEGYKDVLS